MHVRTLALLASSALILSTGCDDSGGGPADAARNDAQIFGPDAGDDLDGGGGGAGGGGGPTETHLRLSYIKATTPRDNTDPTVDLFIYDFQDNAEVNLTRDVSGEDGVNCRSKACLTSPDMGHVGWLKPIPNGGFELWVAPIDVKEKRVLIDAKRLVADSVVAFDFTGDQVVYSAGQAASPTDTIDVWVEPIAGEPEGACPSDDNPLQCKRVVGSINADGGFRVTDLPSLVIYIETTLSTMTINFFNLNNGVTQTLYTFGQQGGTGSQFSGRLPIALAPSAEYLAVFTRNEFIWRAQTLTAVPSPPDPAVQDLFEVQTAPEGDCMREMPYTFNEVRFDPVFTPDSAEFYFLASGDCSMQPGNPNPTNRLDFDILKLSRDLSAPPENVTNNPRVSNWANHDIGDFDIDDENERLAFTASRPNNAASRSIWLIDPATGEYDCSRGMNLAGVDGRNRCEFIFDDSNGVDVQYRELRFHTVEVPQ